MPPVILNRHLYFEDCPRTDLHFLVTREPRIVGEQVVVEVDLGVPAAVLARSHLGYPQQPYSEADIRHGRVPGAWLFSGGALISDEQGKVALGLRDGNAAAPFCFTNVGAGRCDGPLEKHCLEEIASEFVLCLRKPGETCWRQADFGEATVRLDEMELPALERPQRLILQQMCDEPAVVAEIDPLDLGAGVSVCEVVFRAMNDGETVAEECLRGYTMVNPDEFTTEFRLAKTFDLSAYKGEGEMRVFFGEGTGLAVWKSLQEIRAMASIESAWGSPALTPFVRKLAGC